VHAAQPTRFATEHAEPFLSVGCGRAHTVLLGASGLLLGCGLRACLCGAPAWRPHPTSVDWLERSRRGGSAPCAGTEDASSAQGTAECQHLPADLRGGGGGAIDSATAVACGGAHTLVLTDAGQLFSFGQGASGQLGRPAGGSSAGRALRVGGPFASRVVVAAWCSASDTSFAKTDDGAVFIWGAALGLGPDATRPAADPPAPYAASSPCSSASSTDTFGTPTEMVALRGLDVVCVSASASHALALSRGGDLYGFGASEALALLQTTPLAHPTAHALFSRKAVARVACGGGPHTLALLAHDTAGGHGGGVVAWGRNVKGELGSARAGGAPRLVGLEVLAAGLVLVDVAAGGHFSLACGRDADQLFGWGATEAGQLGPEHEGRRSSVADPDGVAWAPLRLPPLCDESDRASASVLRLAAGALGAAAIVSSSGPGGACTVWAWGGGAGRPAPVRSGSLEGATVVAIACGQRTFAAIDDAARVHFWGATTLPHSSSLSRASAAASIAPPARVPIESFLLAEPGDTGWDLARATRLCWCGRRLLVLVEAQVDLHKILSHFKALLWESIVLLLPHPTYKAYAIAILLHDHCAINAPPPTPPLWFRQARVPAGARRCSSGAAGGSRGWRAASTRRSRTSARAAT